MTTDLTPGQQALREAARLEAARVYGGVCREHRNGPGLTALVAEAELAAAAEAADQLAFARRRRIAAGGAA